MFRTAAATVLALFVTPVQCLVANADPFANRQVQFYLPPNKMTRLLKCNQQKIEFYASASPVADDSDEQRFDKFQLKHRGEEIVTVSTRSPTSGSSLEKGASLEKGSRAAILGAALRERMIGTGALMEKQNALDVKIQGNPMEFPSRRELSGGALNVTLSTVRAWSGTLKPRNSVRVEVIGMRPDETSLDMEMYTTAGLQTNLEVNFKSIDATTCTGALPEVWNIRPISVATQRLIDAVKRSQ